MLTVSEAAALLRSFDRVLILTHIRPDGDTVGCAAGLCAALRTIGKTAYLLPNPGLTENTAPILPLQRSGGLRAGKSGIYGHRHGGTVPRQCQVLRG
ncbi:MAG: DHH family phosphoesterase [Dysosmobacter sp.]